MSENTYWDKEKVVSEITLSDYRKLVVSSCIKDGKKYVNVREFYCTRTDSTWKPSKHGICIPNNAETEVPYLLCAALSKASTREDI